MKPKQKRRHPDARRGNAAAAKVTHYDAHSCHAIHFPQQNCRSCAVEVMKYLRAKNDVDAAIAEWQSQCVCAHYVIISAAVSINERRRNVETDRRQSNAALTGGVAGSDGDVTRTRSNVEKRSGPRKSIQRRLELRYRRAYSAEEPVGSLDVRHRSRHNGRIDSGIIEHFSAATTGRSQDSRHGQRSSCA
jgi:hypothetical protein